METRHRVVAGDARSMDALDDDSVDCVVTSPPYPMIEMWDDVFAAQAPAVEAALADGDGEAAFEAMHGVLDAVWDELARVVVDGGVVCLNVGDATRTLEDSFRVYPNHARVVDAMTDRGFEPLPEVVWRKPANSAAKFMGSGMVPPNAYVTLEHEYVLIFRKGDERRSFPPGADRRYEAAYFWEERNEWFSDVWTDVRGDRQAMADDAVRDRSAAYPVAVPYRLLSMYSAYGDRVLDPFWGTGTTTLAAAVAGRDSVGYERDADLIDRFDDRIADVAALSREVVGERLAAHRQFAADEDLAYAADHYDFDVRTKQERGIRFYLVEEVRSTDDGYVVGYEPAGAGFGR